MQTKALRRLISAPGPFTSVYFDDSHHSEDAEKQLELKWRDLRDQLTAAGAPARSLDALEAAVLATPRAHDQRGLGLVATGEQVVVHERLGEPPVKPVARVSDLPYLLPLIRHGEPPLRHVVANVDRVEATVRAFDEHGREIEAHTIRGSDHPVHEVRGGGSAHHDMRERVDETVRRNVSEIANAVGELAERRGAELVVLVGEVQARRAVHVALPKAVRDITHEATHESAVDDLVAGAKHRQLASLDERFRAEVNRERGLAAEGLDEVTAALREANVEILFISDPGDATVFVGDDPMQLALSEQELTALGIGQIQQRRADEAVPLAAIASDADIVSVGDQLAEGLGAILRHR